MGKLEIRLGSAGSGKSAAIAGEIAQLVREQPIGPPIFWVVPQNASYQAERKLLSAVETTVRAEVLHIDRLAGRLQAAVGGIHETAVNATGRRMLLAASYQALSGQLSVLRRVAPTPAFLDAVLCVFEEMAQFLVSPLEIETALETAAAAVFRQSTSTVRQAGQSLLGKLRDLCMLYVDWQRKLSESGLYDPNFLMTKLIPLISEWTDLHGARIYVDGFTSLTPQQIAFVIALAEQADVTVLTLPLPSAVSIHGPASTAGQTLLDVPEHIPVPMAYSTLQQVLAAATAADLDITHAPLQGEPLRFQQAPDLAALERQFYSTQVEPNVVRPTRLCIVEAQSIRAEVTGTAERIWALLEEEDASFEDILVLVSDSTAYQPVIAEVFETFRIPYHTDEPIALTTHPLARFLLAAVRCVRDRASIDAMTRLLRSPFTGFELDDADWLEAYLSAYEVTGAAWFSSQPWRYAYENRENDARLQQMDAEDGRAERLRKRVLQWFGEFYRHTSQPVMTSLHFGQAIWQLLEQVGAKHEIAEWIAGLDATVDPMQASLHEQAWLAVVALLNDLADTRPDQNLPTSFLFQLVEDTLTSSSLMTIPEGLDETAVVSFAQSGAVDGKWVFVLGAVDGTLPRRIHQDSIVLDDEREVFRALFGRQLGWTTQERQQAERSLPYLVCTRASRGLTLSYPIAGEDGKAVRPALAVSRVREIFGDEVPRQTYTHEPVGNSSTAGGAVLSRLNPQAAWELLLPAMRKRQLPPEAAALGRAILGTVDEASLPNWLNRTVAGWNHRTFAAQLSNELASRLYGTDIRMNVHQLEAYAQCAYRYFGQYGLRLKEEQKTDINAAVRGTLLHDAVEQFVRVQMEDPAVMGSLSDEAAFGQMDEILEQLLKAPKMQVWTRTPVRQQQVESVRQVLHAAAMVLTRHVRHGMFRPQAIELNFGDAAEAQLGTWTVSLDAERTLHLRGRIDRVDTLTTDDGEAWFRIIDYKSSKMELDLSKIAHGLQLQLPVYALVIEAHSEGLLGSKTKSAGLIYLPLRHEVKSAALPRAEDEALAERLKAMRAGGKVVADDAVVHALDGRIAAGTSDLFKKFYNKDNGFLKSAPVLHQEDWRWMLEQVEQRIVNLGRSVADGHIDIAPAVYHNEEACRFCPLTAVCSINRKTDQTLYRSLPKWSGDVLSQWRQWVEGDGHHG